MIYTFMRSQFFLMLLEVERSVIQRSVEILLRGLMPFGFSLVNLCFFDIFELKDKFKEINYTLDSILSARILAIFCGLFLKCSRISVLFA